MLTNNRQNSANLTFWIGLLGSLMGLGIGFLVGVKPLYPALLIGAVVIVVCFFKNLEATVLGLLILRSALDPFSAQQLPTAFALGLDGLTLLYVLIAVLTKRKVHTDGFWWFFAGWVMLQGLWLILMRLGGLGLDSSFLPNSIREWVRIFSWLISYLVVMQLKEKLPPQKIISLLFLALVIPLTIALMQLLLPSHLPAVFSTSPEGEISSSLSSETSRVKGTLGLANTFATYLMFFIGLTWWKINQVQRRWPWLILLALLVFLLVSTKSLFSLAMVGVFVLVLIAPRLNLINLIGGVILFALVIGLFASTEFGQQRLASIANTPLLNPEIDISRAVLLSQGDDNSFNWRLAQWTFLLKAWQNAPVFGNGIATSPYLSVLHNYAHNDYVRALTEEGIVGLIAFITFLGAQAARLIHLLRCTPSKSTQHNLCSILLAILLAIAVGMCTENIWSHTTLFFYWWTLLAIAGWNWDEFRTRSQHSSSASV